MTQAVVITAFVAYCRAFACTQSHCRLGTLGRNPCYRPQAKGERTMPTVYEYAVHDGGVRRRAPYALPAGAIRSVRAFHRPL